MNTPAPKSDTPRTDEQAFYRNASEECVQADFARTLERELAAVGRDLIDSRRLAQEREDQLRADRAAAREDTKRLDWLEKEHPDMLFTHDHKQVTLFHATYSTDEWTDLAKEGSVRAAIDAARKQEEKTL